MKQCCQCRPLNWIRHASPATCFHSYIDVGTDEILTVSPAWNQQNILIRIGKVEAFTLSNRLVKDPEM